jgi:hypothetical protein
MLKKTDDTIACKRCGNVVRRKRLAQRYCSKACANAETQKRKRRKQATRSGDDLGACTPLLGSGDGAYVKPLIILSNFRPRKGGLPLAKVAVSIELGFGDPRDEPLQGDDYPLTFDADGYPELPACLDRRKPA